MRPPMGPPPGSHPDMFKEPKPENIKEVPVYLKKIIVKFFSRLFYIFHLVYEAKPWILFVLTGLSLFSGLLPVCQALAASSLLNELAGAFTASAASLEPDENAWIKITGLLVLQFVFIFGISLTGSINSLVTRISGELVANHVRVKIMTKAKDLDIESFDSPGFYAKLENATREADHRPIQIINSVFSLISTIITLCSFFVVLSQVRPLWASAVVIILSIPGAVVSFIYRKKNFRYMRHRSKDRRMLSYFSNIVTDKDLSKEIRIFGLNEIFTKKYKKVFQRYFKGLKALFLKEGGWNISLSLISSAANCILFLIIARQVFEGKIEIGNYSLYTGALNSVASGIAAFISTTSTVYEGTLFIDNLITFMNKKKKIKPITKTPVIPERRKGHRIEFRNVSFSYPGSDKRVINNMSFIIEPGNTVVLVGLNGAGKTTLIKLLTRLYDPDEGTILLDGIDIREYDVEKLYDIYGIIFQDFGRYAVSVEENIAFGQADREINSEKVRLSAEKSSSSQFIDNLPDKYKTPLMRFFEENGTELSIGQWQKLSIARAFYSDSDILILDEPTASLDAIAEQEIYNRFDELRKDKTTVFVSHRLSSATVADKILVIENGCLIEQGTHKELMHPGGKYYELFSTQAKRYIEP